MQRRNFVNVTCQTSTVVTAVGVMLPARFRLTLRCVFLLLLRLIQTVSKNNQKQQNTKPYLSVTLVYC